MFKEPSSHMELIATIFSITVRKMSITAQKFFWIMKDTIFEGWLRYFTCQTMTLLNIHNLINMILSCYVLSDH